ncbi:M1 family aminopeptidase [Streptomyces sp. NPDC017979]|uniref:M1 family aminopeptidase n=1 Tax=Streptomyces sp. NPDC017979 TaxID=3365024 RepID=UPI0037A8D515
MLSRRRFTQLALASPPLLSLSTPHAFAQESGTLPSLGLSVEHYDINLAYEPDSGVLTGSTRIRGVAVGTLTSFRLRFRLRVSSVRVNGTPAAFASDNGVLTVTPKTPANAGDELLVQVRYRDTPAAYPAGDGGWGWMRTPSGAVAVVSAAWWHPAALTPAARATRSVSVLVPKGLTAMSNGTLHRGSPTVTSDGDRWSWDSKTPLPTETALLAIGDYSLTKSRGPDGTPMFNAYGKDLGALEAPARASVERTAEAAQTLSRWFGPYPYEAVGGVVDKAFNNVVATATRPIYGGSYFADGANPSMVAHETAHHWYGNAVAPAEDAAWLSEGFATYAEFLWSEHAGLGTAAELAQHEYDQYPQDDPVWKEAPAIPNPDSFLSFPVYARGALTLQALRTKVGDDTFFRILRGWVTAQKPDTEATTAAFTAYAERLHSRPLDDVFRPWLYGTTRPPVGPNGQGPRKRAAEPTSYSTITRNRERLAAAHHRNRRSCT